MIDLSLITPDNIRALSWKQPYGLLMLPPYNKIETRSWDTGWRQYVLICASKTGYSMEQIEAISGEVQTSRIIKAVYEVTLKYNISHDVAETESHKVLREKIYHEGHAIAIGRLVNSGRMQKQHEDRAYVEYYSDLFVHIYEDVTPIVPFPFKGAMGWKKLTLEEIAKIKYL